jgi:LysR family nitrogen assimilation transcriptional regulator
MDLKHLETLIAIVHEGSFSGAAKALNTVQSNVSEHVKLLEREINAAVLIRTRNGAQLTDAGRLVYSMAKRIEKEIEQMSTQLALTKGLNFGSCSVGFVWTTVSWLEQQTVLKMRQIAPGVTLNIVEASSERLVDLVLKQDLACAVITGPYNDERLHMTPLLEEKFVLVAPGNEKLPKKANMELIARQKLILPNKGSHLRSMIDQYTQTNKTQLKAEIEVEGLMSIPRMVQNGLGWSILPNTAVKGIDGLSVSDIDDMPPRQLLLITLKQGLSTHADQAIHNIIIDGAKNF